MSSLTATLDQLAFAMGLDPSHERSQDDMQRTGQSVEEWVLGRALETLIEQQRALGELPKIAAAARRHGWDGVNNSKLLAVFLDDRLSQADAMDRVRGAIGELEEAQGKCSASSNAPGAQEAHVVRAAAATITVLRQQTQIYSEALGLSNRMADLKSASGLPSEGESSFASATPVADRFARKGPSRGPR